MFALVDCNNFFVSCERVFNPKWHGKPVVVLSNNDGCIISRSNEAKALGIPMGAPYFQYKSLIEGHNGIVCSSNFALYGDLSHRVMETLKSLVPSMQIYSIDEAFLLLSGKDIEHQAKTIKETVLKWTGIPVSIGVASTKTLAKLANYSAKKTNAGICFLLTENAVDKVLDSLPVKEIWGIGRRLGLKLNRMRILTAKELTKQNDELIKKHLSVVGLRIVWELRGISCLLLEEVRPAKQSITVSRSFSQPIETLTHLNEAISTYTAQAAEKMRAQHSLAASMIVYVEQHPYSPARSGFHVRTVFPEPTAYTPSLIESAQSGIKALFKKGTRYRKAGVILDNLVKDRCYQQDFLSPINSYSEKQKRLMETLDQINQRYGKNTIYSLAEGISKPWKMKQTLRTPLFTTDWKEILKVKI